MRKQVNTLCFMCTVRCPITVEVDNDQVVWIQGNEKAPGMGSSLCPRGAAGMALLKDDQRVQYPLIRTGPRGSNQWKRASWDEALDYIAEKLQNIFDTHGPQSMVFGERTQLSTNVSKTFVKALGSPNHFTHDSLCKGSVNTACRSLFGFADGKVGMDYANTKHVVIYGRNLFEAMSVKEVKQLTKALENGAKLTYIDPRVTVTATKATRYWMIRPGTDLAVNYALMNTIIEEKLFDEKFVSRWVHGFEELAEFVKEYTPEWAEQESGIPAKQIRILAREMAEDSPNVIFNYGYRGSNHTNEIYFRRSILMLNALMGSIETKGGIFFKKDAAEAGGKAARGLTSQDIPAVDTPRFDKVGTPEFPLPDKKHGTGQVLPYAIMNDDPYPIKALICYRIDPVKAIGDARKTIEAFDKLDLIVTIDVNHSDIAWYSDVVLPECSYLERTDCIQQVNSLKPAMFLRRRAVTPRYDTKPGPIILKLLAERMGKGQFFPYETMEELVEWQLKDTGFKLSDFDEKGFVSYTKDPIRWDREDGLKFKTPSGKIEFKSSLIEDAGFESFPKYQTVQSPPEGAFRLTVGRKAAHTHGSTQNNPLLHELTSENELWINTEEAARCGISDGDCVLLTSSRGTGSIKAKVTDLIHPEAVFMLHGFGHRNELAKRTCGRGASDADLQENIHDKVGGSPAYHDVFVRVSPEACREEAKA